MTMQISRDEVSEGILTNLQNTVTRSDGRYVSFVGFPSALIQDTYQVVITIDEDGRYVAKCIDLQGVVSEGDTEEDAITNINEAVIGMLEILHKPKQFNLLIHSEF